MFYLLLFIIKFKLSYLKVYYNCLKRGTTINLSTDINLIIECCKTKQNNTTIEQLILKINDWEEFIDLAYVHGVFPLVYHTLKSHIELIPTEVLQTMKSQNMEIAKQNMLMTSELIKVMKLFEKNNIEVIALKGPVLSQMAYGDITLRQYVDLDILVDEEHLYKTAKLFLENNYKAPSPISLLQNKQFCILDNDFSIFTPKNNTHIELHWRLFRKKIGNHQAFQEYYKNKSNVAISNYELSTLSIETLLIYLCIHGSKHAWERIEWINDIHFLITKNININWKTVMRTADIMESKIALLSSLNLCKTFYSTKLPNDVSIKINTDKLNKLTKEAFYFIENSSLGKENYSYYRKVMLFQTKLLDTKVNKFKYILNSYFSITRNDYLAFPLPPYLNFLYYFIKPFRIVYKVLIKGK